MALQRRSVSRPDESRGSDEIGQRLARLWHEMSRPQARSGYLFLLPSLIILGVFVFWPILQSVLLSLQDWRFGQSSIEWVGLENYQRLFKDPRVLGAFRNAL